MSSGRILGLSVATLLVAAIWACGGDDGGNGDNPSADGGDNDGGANPDGAPPPPTRAEFGLDSRPPNPTCKAPARPPNTQPIQWAQVFMGVNLNTPMVMAQPPGDNTKWFVAQRGGTVAMFPTANAAAIKVVANLATLAGVGVVTSGEGGFLGMAIHPKFAQNGRIYVSWTSSDPATPGSAMRSQIGYLTSSDGGNSFTAYKQILFFDQTNATNHKGGGLAFGKDGYLYASFGDGGGGDDTFVNGQTKTGFFSKILRLDVDKQEGGKEYAIPDGNPFKAGGGAPEVFAYGFRNPYRFSIDRETNDVWVGDVGQNQWEEVDAKVKAGGNYGWPCKEATHDYLNANPTKCPNPGATLIDPIVELQHLPNPNTRAITGGVVYRGKAIPAFVGTYVYGDYVKHELWGLSFDPGTGEVKNTRLNESGIPNEPWNGFAEDADGEVYAHGLSGNVFKLVAAGPQPPDTFPKALSETGCVVKANPKQPASGLVAYGVNSPLWSDGAKKDRWMALPDNTTIKVLEDGDFDFPNGTVLMKSFSVADKLVETRLLMRHDDGGWAGYTYEWNDAQTDATLLPSSKSKPAGNQTWYYPSRSECVTCHTEAAGRSLGLELGQQNGDYVYVATNRISNQLKTLEHIGMFSAPLGKPVDQIIAYPDPLGTTGTAEARARAYLHSNCSHCHRPKGGGGGDIDVQFGTALKDTKTCDVDPQRGDLGVAGAKILTPGKPDLSMISLRPHRPASNRMPPLGSSIIDDKGVKSIDDWITSLTACPQ